MSQENDSRLKLTAADLKDPSLTRFNYVINNILDRINAIRNNGVLTGTTKVDNLIGPDTQENPADNQIVPWGVLKRLLSPQAQRTALVQRTWLGAPVRVPTGTGDPNFGNNSALGVSIVDTHNERVVDYLPDAYDVGTLFYETDRDSLYEIHNVAGVKRWVWIAGEMRDAIVNRPSDLGVYDENFLFYSTDTFYTFRWDGLAWVIVPVFSDKIELSTLSNDRYLATCFNATANTASGLTAQRARGTPASPSDVQVGDRLGFFSLRGFLNGAFTVSSIIESLVESLPGGTAIASSIRFITTNTFGAAGNRWSIVPNGHLIPDGPSSYDVGSSSDTVRDIYTDSITADDSVVNNSFQLTPGATNNYVLTSDAAGVGTWQAAAGGSIASVSARASGSLALTTSFTDVPGASVSLATDGVWYVTACFSSTKTLNDTQIQGCLVVNGVTQTGIIQMGNAAPYDGYFMGTQSWIVTVAGGPYTAKLQGLKIGTGSSSMNITNTTITALYLRP